MNLHPKQLKFTLMRLFGVNLGIYCLSKESAVITLSDINEFAAKRQTIPAFREKGVWKIGATHV